MEDHVDPESGDPDTSLVESECPLHEFDSLQDPCWVPGVTVLALTYFARDCGVCAAALQREGQQVSQPAQLG